MLTFLEALCDALRARNAARVRELIATPMASMLPGAVHEEIRAVLDGSAGVTAAPIHTMRLYHQTAQLLGVRADPAARSTVVSDVTERTPKQFELPIPALIA